MLHGVARCYTMLHGVFSYLRGYGVLKSTSGGWSNINNDYHIHISYMEATGWLSGVDLWEIMEFGIAGRSYRILGCQGDALPGGNEYGVLSVGTYLRWNSMGEHAAVYA